MSRQLVRSARDAVSALGLASAAFWLYGKASLVDPRCLIRNSRYQRFGAPDGLPVPPAKLRFLVAGTTDIGWFLKAGELGAVTVQDALSRQGVAMDRVHAVLDFGCGCGRVLRNWRTLGHSRVFGCDYNQNPVDWCGKNLPFASVAVNHLHPPLPYADESFDASYAFSVFTHLTQELQQPWLTELARIARPGGFVMLSTHGASYLHRLNRDERRRFQAGELIVKNLVRAPGSNACSAYHPREYFDRNRTPGLEVVDFVPQGALGNPVQDLYVFRKT